MIIDELVCYSDSLHYVNLIKGPQVKYHIHAVLIQDIKELLFQTNVSVYHTLREENQCVDFLTHASSSKGICNLLRNDAMGTSFRHD
jgi:hypothetical protein